MNELLSQALVSFFLYGFIGWVLDSVYRSMVDRRWARGGCTFLPFTPSYGIGAVILLVIGPTIVQFSYPVQWLLLGVIFGGYEYLCGRVTVRVFRRRLWDYSRERMNIHGHTDLRHIVYWATLAFLVLHYVNPWVFSTEEFGVAMMKL